MVEWSYIIKLTHCIYTVHRLIFKTLLILWVSITHNQVIYVPADFYSVDAWWWYLKLGLKSCAAQTIVNCTFVGSCSKLNPSLLHEQHVSGSPGKVGVQVSNDEDDEAVHDCNPCCNQFICWCWRLCMALNVLNSFLPLLVLLQLAQSIVLYTMQLHQSCHEPARFILQMFLSSFD